MTPVVKCSLLPYLPNVQDLQGSQLLQYDQTFHKWLQYDHFPQKWLQYDTTK